MPTRIPIASMRLPAVLSIALSMFSQTLLWASAVQAQGFFQQLFGVSQSPPARTAPRWVVPQQSVASSPWRIINPRETSNGPVAPEGSGSYTTVCVRMCDGFYFPISSRVPPSRFGRDADACSARCGGSEARLFYHSTTNGDMHAAVDLNGRSYTKLPVAFLHRKKLVDGCGCKPEPWSQAAQIRHQGYAMAEGRVMPGSSRDESREASNGIGTLTIIAGNYDASPAASREAETASDGTDADTPPLPLGNTTEAITDDQTSLVSPARSRSGPTPLRSGAKTRSLPGSAGAKSTQRSQWVIAALRKPTRIASVTAPTSRMVWPGDSHIGTR